MNILFLSRSYLPNVGGVEKHIFEISKILSRKHHLTLITEQTTPPSPEFEHTPTLDIYRIPLHDASEKNKKWIIWKWLWQHRDLLNTDIIHVHDVFYWLLPYRFILKRPQIFITFHGYEGSQPPGYKQVFMHRLAEKLSHGSLAIGDFHRKWYGTKAQFVSYGGVTAKYPKSTIRSNKAIFIGRIAQDTGILDYIKASHLSKTPLYVYGSGPQLSAAQELVSSLKAPVKFMGFKYLDIKDISHYSVAFVSRYLGILECLISKTPIIAHYDSPIKYDYLSQAPFARFINIVTSPNEIVASLSQMHDNKVRKQVTAGFNWAKQQTWEAVARTYTKLWQTKFQL